MAGITISTISSLELTVSGAAQTYVSIASMGGVEPAAGPAIFADAPVWSLANQGTLIGGTAAAGIYVAAGTASIANQGYIGGQTALSGDIILQNTGLIAGRTGAGVSGTGSVVNRGTIIGGAVPQQGDHSAIGVALAGGTLVNGLIGLVRGDYEAVHFSGSGTVLNLGTMIGGNSTGVVLDAGGTLTNGSSTARGAVIEGQRGGVSLGTAGTVVNYGHITTASGSGPRNGIGLGDGGLVLNSGRVDGFNGISAGTGTIENSGTISGGAMLSIAIPFAGYQYVSGAGVVLAGGTLRNAGLVLGGSIPAFPTTASGTAGAGVTLQSGYVLNTGSIAGGTAAGGTLTGGSGLFAMSGSLVNAGRLSGGAAYHGGTGLTVLAGAQARNSGTIQGGAGSFGGAGVLLSGGSLQNSGRITGGDGTLWGWAPGLAAGVDIYNGLLINTGSITGGAVLRIGVDLGSGTLQNSGAITGTTGVLMQSGQAYNSGLISGTSVGIEVTAGTLVNAGTISGRYAVYMALSARRLIAEPGALFRGTVTAKTLGATLELAGGTLAAGTLDMGASFSGFSSIVLDAGTQWVLGGGLAQLAGGQRISGFTQGDTLELEGFHATSAQFISGTGLELSDGSTIVTLGITGSFAAGEISASADLTGTRIAICYTRGTRIMTIRGERPVEALDIGDELPAYFAGTQKVRWIGRQNFTLAELTEHPARWPVRISTGALGGGLPRRALTVSPGHSLFIGGRLVLARALVNGVTITQPAPRGDVAYYLVEFARHDCLLAEGAWAESFADGPGLRAHFHNEAEFHRLYPGHTEPAQIRLCAPRPERGPELEAALRPIAARAALGPLGSLRGHVDRIEGRCIEGWVHDEAWPDLPQLIEFSAAGRKLGQALACHYRPDLAAAAIGRGHAHFHFTAPADFTPGSLRIRRVADHSELPHGWEGA